MHIRPLTVADQAIVWQMLMYAAHESNLATVQSLPVLARYGVDWGRVGDWGCVAWDDQQPLGAAWVRLWTENETGFGWVEDGIPELAIAVIPSHRGQGIGTQLLRTLLTMVTGVYPAVSLSVRSDNPAIALYERCGFVPVEGTAVPNRVGSVSFTMLCTLDVHG